MDPRSPNKLIATKYCFLILGDDTSFFFFISIFFVVFLLLLLFCYYLFLQKIYYYYYFILFIYLFLKIILFFHVPGSCSGMFRNVPACSGMFHVPGFIDVLRTVCAFVSLTLDNILQHFTQTASSCCFQIIPFCA